MIWLVSRLRTDFRAWERSTRLSFALAACLLVVALLIVLLAPSDSRLPVLIGAFALALVLELTVLWGNRGMLSAFTRAQRLYVNGDLEAARDLLEAARAASRLDARTLTLLGNTYRQLGQLDASEAVLYEAMNKAPNHYFPIYGFGRTLLSEGRYAEAADAIRHALELNAPSVVQVDLGEAYYRLDRPQEALTALHAVAERDIAQSEPYRELIVSYLLYRLEAAPPPAPEMIHAGLPYWQAAAERFHGTPYGVALVLDVREMLKQGNLTI